MDDETRENPGLRVVEGSAVASRPSPARAPAPIDDGLSERQRLFVDFYCGGVPADLTGEDEDTPAGSARAAALAAGYAESGAHSMASRNLLNPAIQAEIERRVKMGRGSALLAGVSALFKVVDKGTDERAVVTAAMALLDRFGMAPPKGPAVAVQVNNISGTEASAVLQQIAERAARRLGHTED